MISEYENKSEARHAEAECAEGAVEKSVTVSAEWFLTVSVTHS